MSQAPQQAHNNPPPLPWDWGAAVGMGVIHLGALAAPFTYSHSGLALAIVLAVLTGLATSLGYHRLLAHRSFKCSKWLEYLLTFFAASAGQGGPVQWVTIHRLHHGHADREGDPHNARQGFWWSHMGWIFSTPPHKLSPEVLDRVAPDLRCDHVHRWLDCHFHRCVMMQAALLYALGGWSWLVWGVFVRLTATLQFTFLVNSAAHTFGYRSYDTPDRSTNCWWVALLTVGEGWHNNHHAFPQSARIGLKAWEFDPAWYVLRALERANLVWDVKLPPKHKL